MLTLYQSLNDNQLRQIHYEPIRIESRSHSFLIIGNSNIGECMDLSDSLKAFLQALNSIFETNGNITDVIISGNIISSKLDFDKNNYVWLLEQLSSINKHFYFILLKNVRVFLKDLGIESTSNVSIIPGNAIEFPVMANGIQMVMSIIHDMDFPCQLSRRAKTKYITEMKKSSPYLKDKKLWLISTYPQCNSIDFYKQFGSCGSFDFEHYNTQFMIVDVDYNLSFQFKASSSLLFIESEESIETINEKPKAYVNLNSFQYGKQQTICCLLI